ncbi:MAG: hypothetical protein R3360_01440 [Alphaproteobacteria bacterium]|nr:hypothetical protein [Alphaproteobacteria bacterium]
MKFAQDGLAPPLDFALDPLDFGRGAAKPGALSAAAHYVLGVDKLIRRPC